MLIAAVHVSIILAAFVGMEAFAWAMHRWVMHGPWGWTWHASHHEEPIGGGMQRRGFELNDLFAVVFAAPAILLFWVGSLPGWNAAWWAACGVTAYGVMYAVVHDGLVHHRWPFRLIPKRGYAKRLVQAHRLHHSTLGRGGAVSFGFLYAPDVRRLKSQLRDRAAAPAVADRRR